MMCLAVPTISDVQIGENVFVLVNRICLGEFKVVEKEEEFHLMGVQLTEEVQDYLNEVKKMNEKMLIQVATTKEIQR